MAAIKARELRDLWYALARLRESKGDLAGAARARRTAWIVGDPRPRPKARP